MKLINSKCLIFFGAPGVGKGTYGKIFARNNKFQKISPGDELRKLINNDFGNDPKINLIKSLLSQGKFIDDDSILSTFLDSFDNLLDLVVKTYHKNLEEHFEESQNGFILDGFPRTVQQMELMFKYFNKDSIRIINIEMPHEIISESKV
jgi:adenylate kinase